MYRVLLSCASAMVRPELFEPGLFTHEEAEAAVARIKAASPGVIGYVVPDGADPRTVLHEKGWI